MGFFTLDIKDNKTNTIKYYTIKYEFQMNGIFVVNLYDEYLNEIVPTKCDTDDLKCFNDLRNDIVTFGKILTIHEKYINDTNITYVNKLKENKHTLILEINGNKFSICYIDESVLKESINSLNANGLIKINSISNSLITPENHNKLFILHKVELFYQIKKIVENNRKLYDHFEINYDFDEETLINNFEMTKYLKIKHIG